MSPTFFLFLLIPLLLGTVQVLEEGQIGGNGDDEIIVENNEPLDLSNVAETVPETTETVGGVEVQLTQEVEFIAVNNDVIVLINTDTPAATVEIPDQTIVSGPDAWNGKLTVSTFVASSGSVDPAFVAPTTALLFGSPDVILVFDKAVTILLTGTTGQVAYKTPGSSTWILISGCTGTYAAPDNPPANGECSISNGADTKIVTFHFTEFSGLSASTPSTPSAPGSSGGGGSGNVGVGSPRIFGPGSSGGGGSSGGYSAPADSGPRVFPAWFDNVKDWYRLGDISATEFLHAYQWIIENVMK